MSGERDNAKGFSGLGGLATVIEKQKAAPITPVKQNIETPTVSEQKTRDVSQVGKVPNEFKVSSGFPEYFWLFFGIIALLVIGVASSSSRTETTLPSSHPNAGAEYEERIAPPSVDIRGSQSSEGSSKIPSTEEPTASQRQSATPTTRVVVKQAASKQKIPVGKGKNDEKPTSPSGLPDRISRSAVKYFKTLVKTKVMAEPTIGSPIVSELPADSIVMVTGSKAAWVEVRSIQGKVGYIFRQDVLEQE